MDVSYVDGVSDEIKNTVFKICPFMLFDNANAIEMKNGETTRITINLQNIVTYYKELQSTALGTDSNTDWYGKYVLFYMVFDSAAYSPENHEKITFTISNFGLVA